MKHTPKWIYIYLCDYYSIMNELKKGFNTIYKVMVNNISGYHCKAHISLLQSWSVIGSISCYCDNLPLFYDGAVNDAWMQMGRKERLW